MKISIHAVGEEKFLGLMVNCVRIVTTIVPELAVAREGVDPEIIRVDKV